MTIRLFVLLWGSLVLSSLSSTAQIIARVAGNGTSIPGYSGNGQLARNAEMHYPTGLACDKQGNIYVADYMNAVIRKIDKQGIITLFAGKGEQGHTGDGGPATAAKLIFPTHLFFDRAGNLFFSDFQIVRKIDINGIITTFAGADDVGSIGENGPATAAHFKNPGGIAEDKAGNIYIADADNDRIRKVDAAGIITAYAGSYSGYSGDGGPASAALFRHPSDITFDKYGNMFIADMKNNVIRKIDTNDIVSTVAGDGTGAGTIGGGGWSGDGWPATDANISAPVSIKVDDSGALYFCEILNHVVRKVDPRGIVNTIAGTTNKGISKEGTLAKWAHLNQPYGLWVVNSHEIYFTDRYNNRVLKIIDNTPPAFIHDNSHVADLCSDSGKYSLGTPLSAIDDNKLQGLSWNVVQIPLHGAVVGGYESVGGDIAVPETMYYMPDRNYTGSDSFMVVVTDGYYADSTVIRINVVTDGEISCWPVPSKGEIHLKGVFGCNSQDLELAVFNTIGQRVLYKPIVATNGVLDEQLVLDSSLSRGIYFLKIIGPGQYRVFRLQLE